MENKKSILVMLGLVALILILAASQAYMGVKPPLRTTDEPVATESGQPTVKEVSAVIEFTGTEFIPKTVTVKKSQTVKFINTGPGNMQIASNPHPTHTDLPELDQGKDASAKGKSSYSFTFDKIGTWKFHNHQPLVEGGTVVVTK